MKYCTYDKVTGQIIDHRFTSPFDLEKLQIRFGENVGILQRDDLDGATHIINGEPITIPPPPPTAAELLVKIKQERNGRLRACDWTQLEDAPFSTAKKHDWKVYRQELRDFPETCDPFNPVWPVAPV